MSHLVDEMCLSDLLFEIWSSEQINFMKNVKWRHKICFCICMQLMLIVHSRHCINSSYKKAWYEAWYRSCWLHSRALYQLITLWMIKRTNRGPHTRAWYDELIALMSMLPVWKNDSCVNLMKLVMGWLRYFERVDCVFVHVVYLNNDLLCKLQYLQSRIYRLALE